MMTTMEISSTSCQSHYFREEWAAYGPSFAQLRQYLTMMVDPPELMILNPRTVEKMNEIPTEKEMEDSIGAGHEVN